MISLVILILVLKFMEAGLAKEMAKSKGIDPNGAWFLAFIFPVIIVLWLAILPNEGDKANIKTEIVPNVDESRDDLLLVEGMELINDGSEFDDELILEEIEVTKAKLKRLTAKRKRRSKSKKK